MLMGGALILAAFCAVMARSMFRAPAAPAAVIATAPPEPAGPDVLAGETMPRSGWRQRSRASKPLTVPPSASTKGW